MVLVLQVQSSTQYPWRAVDHEGEVLKGYVTKRRDCKAILKFLNKTMKRFGRQHVIVTNLLRSCATAMKVISNADRQETRRWLNNRAENSHLPFPRRERAMLHFPRTQNLQKFVSVQISIHNHCKQERHHYSREGFKLNPTISLVE